MGKLSDEYERRDELLVLTKTEGWKRFHSMLQEQMQSRRILAMQPSSGMDGALKTEFVKGEYAGLLLAASWVDKVIASQNSAIELLEKKDDKNESAE